MAPHFRDEPSLLDVSDDAQYLVRAPRREDGCLVGEDRRMHVPPPAPRTIAISIDRQLLQAFERLPRRVDTVEVDLFMLPHAVRDEPGSRPYFPYHLLIVEAASGLILTTDLLKPEPSLEAMGGTVPQKLLEGLAAAGSAPRKSKCAAGCSNSSYSPSLARQVFPSRWRAPCALSMPRKGNCSGSWASDDLCSEDGELWRASNAPTSCSSRLTSIATIAWA